MRVNGLDRDRGFDYEIRSLAFRPDPSPPAPSVWRWLGIAIGLVVLAATLLYVHHLMPTVA